MSETSLIQSLIMALAIGVSSGAIGAFVILKRMALVGDALSHVALPGIALAITYAIDPFWGLLFSLLAAAVAIWWLEGKTTLSPEALVGILFTASLAIGILTIPDQELVDSLFGAFSAFSPFELAVFALAAVFLTVASFYLAKKFLFSIISPEVAIAHGVSKKYDMFLFLIFSATVALGIKLVGTLLMGALAIIPGSIAKNLSGNMKTFMPLSAAIGGVISVAGVLLANQFSLLPGPTIVLVGIGFFLVSLLFVKK